MNQSNYLSLKKVEELKKELEELKDNKIPDIANKIDEAKQLGDLSENAEYHAAKDEMAWTQGRVIELDHILNDYILINDDKNKDSVTLGSKVIVEVNGKQKEFTIVGQQEADPLEGKISNESPIGEALIGAKKGEKIKINTPAGEQEYLVKQIG